MGKIVVAVLGRDRPGIIATVSRVLFEEGYNIEDVSQTILQTEFAGVFIASRGDDRDDGALRKAMEVRLMPLGLLVLTKDTGEERSAEGPPSEPFVITTVGPDRPGLVAGITAVLAGYGVNITNLKAVFRGVRNPLHNMMYYEVDVPLSVDLHALRTSLCDRSRELGIDLTLQHRDIFEQIHRV